MNKSRPQALSERLGYQVVGQDASAWDEEAQTGRFNDTKQSSPSCGNDSHHHELGQRRCWEGETVEIDHSLIIWLAKDISDRRGCRATDLSGQAPRRKKFRRGPMCRVTVLPPGNT